MIFNGLLHRTMARGVGRVLVPVCLARMRVIGRPAASTTCEIATNVRFSAAVPEDLRSAIDDYEGIFLETKVRHRDPMVAAGGCAGAGLGGRLEADQLEGLPQHHGARRVIEQIGRVDARFKQ